MKKRLLTILFSVVAILALSGVVVSAEDVNTPPEENTPEEEMQVGVIRPKAITVSPNTLSLKRGQAYRLTASPISAFQGSTYSWYSSNPSVAVVSADGIVRCLSSGTVTITAQFDIDNGNYTCYDTCTISVSSSAILVSDTYFFCNEDSGLYINGPISPNSSTWIYMNSLNRTMNLRWLIILGSDGYYTIKSVVSNKNLTIQANNQNSGSYDIRLTSSTSNESKWSVFYQNGKYIFISKVSGTSPIYLSEIGSDDVDYLGTSHSQNYLSSWNVIRRIGTSGAEVPMGGSEWEDYYTSYQYAMNFNAAPYYPYVNAYNQRPGALCGHPVGQSVNDPEALIAAAELDNTYIRSTLGSEYVFHEIGKYDDCSEDRYKIALCVGTNGSLWLRQDPDGFWSYFVWEDQAGEVRFLDSNNNLIIDPEIACFDGYETYVSCFEVTPLNIIYDGD